MLDPLINTQAKHYDVIVCDTMLRLATWFKALKEQNLRILSSLARKS